ncbi:MAG: hypothetical protein QHC78_20545 [Pigmentiphaga sp.]|uniref:hypothetical protein n=1 Tax=Pigmentiphaga sp. TaxID=1977564 RepID=UPI0029BE3290|nr:hypothetical protein [Pigmentiphaga sp.]MDX3908084.1 hypothetical protein [Pigmentiphaga sp.]
MPADINEVQEAMRVWEQAHAEMQIYFAEQDILKPACWERWTALVEAETLARNQALTALNDYHDTQAGGL